MCSDTGAHMAPAEVEASLHGSLVGEGPAGHCLSPGVTAGFFTAEGQFPSRNECLCLWGSQSCGLHIVWDPGGCRFRTAVETSGYNWMSLENSYLHVLCLKVDENLETQNPSALFRQLLAGHIRRISMFCAEPRRDVTSTYTT